MPQTEAQKRWVAENPERVGASKKRWADRNRELIQSHAREKSKEPAEKVRKREYWARHRALKVDNPDRWLRGRLSPTRARAERLGVSFNIHPADIELPTHCPILGVELRYGAYERGPYNPSFDRIIPERGYVKGNVRVISHLANSCRQNCDDPEVFRALARDAESLKASRDG